MNKTEKEKMLLGELYDPADAELVQDRMRSRILQKEFNDSPEFNIKGREEILKKLIPEALADVYIQPPFYCDYGSNIKIGERVFFNFNCVILDVMKVEIGHRTMFGPNVQVYTATHPLNAKERASGLEYAKPVVIGEDVWIGGSAVICPGVNIGDRAVIGAGSVVTRDIPSDVFAAGNPCRVIKEIQ